MFMLNGMLGKEATGAEPSHSDMTLSHWNKWLNNVDKKISQRFLPIYFIKI
jgi:hypothetical protein